MNRRRFLGLAAGGLAAMPHLLGRARAAAAPVKDVAAPQFSAGCRAGLDVARRHILTYCATLSFPNGAIHAVRALGRECPLGPGDPYRLLLESCAVEGFVSGRMFLEVPADREGHRNAMLKTLLERGCEMDLEFAIQGRPYRFRDLVESARLLTSYPGNLAIDEHSWTILAMVHVVPPSEPRWQNARGEIVDLGRMIDDTGTALEADTELIRAVDLARPDLPRDCPVLARACGGLHMFYALAVALARGWETPERRRSFAGHVRTMLRRLVYDERIIDDVYRANVKFAGQEAARAVAFDARVKFLGHLFEGIGVADRHRLYDFTPQERRALGAARERLCRTLAESRDMRFERYRDNLVLYDSMTTSICHAYYGLHLSPG